MSGWTGSFQKLSGVDTLFDFTLTKAEQHTFTIDAKVSGEAKLVLTQGQQDRNYPLGRTATCKRPPRP